MSFVPDKKMWFSEEISEPDAVFYNVKKAPFTIYGLYDATSDIPFRRIPSEIAERVSDGVVYLHRNTAGGRVRFSTDSPYLILRMKVKKVHKFAHMAAVAGAGFDLYEDNPEGGSVFRHSFIPPATMTEGYESKYSNNDGKLHYYTLNFPLYNDVDELWIGIKDGSTLGEGLPYDGEKPIVYYGSSITQGACASRPGNSYEAMICRRLGRDYLNMGFSGSAKGEAAMAEYLATLPMSLFVCDYDYNAPSAEHLEATHYPFYEIIRAKNPTIPYLMISRHTAHRSENADRRRAAIRASYEKAKANGDENVYFLDGDSFFPDEWRDACTVDTTHPNDLGFYFMARAIGDAIAAILGK
ncbi:MAG: SGNH/GDSL hydrolase family protein [Clostridia bacterium]|nr:SGNH/GDSL hydrolase family protein [Clostridia bacterium]